MRRILDLRITRWELKLVWVLGVYAISAAAVWVVPQLEPFAFIARVVSTLLLLGGCLLCARIFRGRGEPVAPARPWWQMTARAKLSWWLGILLAAGTAVIVVNEVGEAMAAGAAMPVGLPGDVLTIFEPAALAFLYLNSAIRLGRRRSDPTPPTPTPTPTFRPKRIRLR
jgi:hypothetical protein